MTDLFTVEERTSIASLLYKLAIRVQNAIKRPLDIAKAGPLMDSALGGKLSMLTSYFTPSKKDFRRSNPASLAKSNAFRTFVPGHGDGIRAELFIGPILSLEDSSGPAVITQETTRSKESLTGLSGTTETVRGIRAIMSSKLGGASPNVNILTGSSRDVDDAKFKFLHGTHEGKRKIQIINTQTGDIALYEDLKGHSGRQGVEDAHRPAVFSSAKEAIRALNELTKKSSRVTRPPSYKKEYTLYIKYSATWVKGSDMFNVLDSLLPAETSDRSLELDSRMENTLKEVANG